MYMLVKRPQRNFDDTFSDPEKHNSGISKIFHFFPVMFYEVKLASFQWSHHA